MRYRLKVVCVVCVVALVAATAFAGAVFATPISGVTSTVFAVGRFDEIDARARTGHWRARIQTNSPTDVHVLENRIAPGGTFGWHSHPGPSLVVVTSGTLTLYRGDDPHCTPSLVQAGSGFVDNGDDVHLVRNEGSVETVVYVTSLVPAGAVRRIDQPAPGNCPF
ncbi:MAG: cupin domain-containing protein [Actinomycetota bacterium]|nr:cupin domain-containing protein [Actinomycetota bacterium]